MSESRRDPDPSAEAPAVSTAEPELAPNEVTRGPLASGLVKFAAPLTLAMASSALYVLVDMIWVGKLGVAAVAGVLGGGLLIKLGFAFQLGAQTGAMAFLARRFGADDMAGARVAARQGLLLSVGLGTIVAVIYGVFAESLMSGALGQSAAVSEAGAAYLIPSAIFMPLVFLQSQLATVLQAIGESRKTTAIYLISALVNIVLDPILIFGWIGPELGVAGAAWATIAARGVGALLGMAFLLSPKGPAARLAIMGEEGTDGFPRPGRLMLDMIRVGTPRFIQFAFLPASQILLVGFAVTLVAAADRDAVSAALTVCARLEFMVMLPTFGLSRSVAVYVGQNLGAGFVRRAWQSAGVAVGLSMLYLILASTLLVTAPRVILSPFLALTERPSVSAREMPGPAATIADHAASEALRKREKVLEYGSRYLSTVGLMLAFWSCAIILNSAVNGAGDTLVPAILMALMLLGGRVGLAWYRAPELGVDAIWWAIAASMALSGVLFALYFLTGRWVRELEPASEPDPEATSEAGSQPVSEATGSAAVSTSGRLEVATVRAPAAGATKP